MATRAIWAALTVLFIAAGIRAQVSGLRTVRVGNVSLAYIEEGSGEPLILLHGGQSDYRSWLPHLPSLSSRFRVISYSRRYNYPNDNPITSDDHSAYIEADDLAALIKKLGLKRVHLVGTSMGAFAALIVAVKHPKLVASLVLAEPNIHAWVEDSPEFKKFMTEAWLPATAAFKAGKDKDAMRYLIDIFGGTGTFDRMPPAAVEIAMQNSKFFKAATMSNDHSPDISKNKVRKLKVPVLIVNGANTFPMFKLIVDELGRQLPNADKAVIPNAGHGSPRQDPAAFTEVVLKFMDKYGFGNRTDGNN